MIDRKERIRLSAIALLTFAVADLSRSALFSIDAYQSAIESLPTFFRYLEQPTRWLCICLVGLYIAHRMSPRKAFRELGLTASVPIGLVVAFVATTPMLIPSLIWGRFNESIDWYFLLFTATFWPIGEEILFRGYVFRQLHRRAGWNFWTAALLTSSVFGLLHLASASVQQQPLAGQFGTVAMISILSVFGAWVFTRWDDNLWVLVGLHGFMNLYWDLFEMAADPLGGWGPNIMRLGCLVAIILLTIYRKPLMGRLGNLRRTTSGNLSEKGLS